MASLTKDGMIVLRFFAILHKRVLERNKTVWEELVVSLRDKISDTVPSPC